VITTTESQTQYLDPSQGARGKPGTQGLAGLKGYKVRLMNLSFSFSAPN